MTQKSIKIGDFLLRKKDIITVQDGEKYKRITIRMNKLGVLQRDEVMGVDIGTKKQYIVKGGEFIISKIDARNGAFGIVPESLKGAIITGDFLAYDINTELVDMDFFLAFISLNNFEKICAQASSGTTNRQRLSEPKFLNFEIQIPDTLGEQKEMMEKYREYKKGFSELKNLSEKNEKLIKALKSSILQDAIQGKLVPQDPSEESAKILLQRIKLEKELEYNIESLGVSGKNSKMLYILPQGWEWVRLGDIMSRIHYGYTASANTSLKEVKMLRITDIQEDSVNWENVPGCEITDNDFRKYDLKNDDILIARTGGTIGKSYLVSGLEKKAVFASYLIRLIPTKNIQAKYIKYYLGTPFYWEQLFIKANGTGQPNVNGVALSNLIIPLPPYHEQIRIIEKIDDLIEAISILQEKVYQTNKKTERLMENVLQMIFNG